MRILRGRGYRPTPSRHEPGGARPRPRHCVHRYRDAVSVHDHSLRELRHRWSGLGGSTLDDLVGDLEASYVGATLRAIAPRGLALVGLPRWYGKRFVAAPDSTTTLAGTNLLRIPGAPHLTETLPMTAEIAPSWADARPAVVVTYPSGGARPWRWVRDEVRRWDDGVLLGLTFVDLPGLRRAPGTPFVLRRADRPRGVTARG